MVISAGQPRDKVTRVREVAVFIHGLTGSEIREGTLFVYEDQGRARELVRISLSDSVAEASHGSIKVFTGLTFKPVRRLSLHRRFRLLLGRHPLSATCPNTAASSCAGTLSYFSSCLFIRPTRHKSFLISLEPTPSSRRLGGRIASRPAIFRTSARFELEAGR